jgi:predicted O-linked N-acetylglucosamine transferase (SPINDLY family)
MDLKAMAEEAVRIHQQGDLAGAERLYLHILDADPSLFGPRYYMGLLRLQQGRSEDAAGYLGEALRISPDNVGARYNLAVALMGLQRAQEALVAFDSVIAAGAHDAKLFNHRGVALWNLKRPAEALASFERALALEPQFAESWGNRGLALRDLARHEEALGCFDHLLARAPRNAVAWNCRGNVLRDMQRFDEAIESYGKAIDVHPGYAEALNNRGYVWWAEKHAYAPALADLERAMLLDPEHPYARGEILHLKMIGADWSDYEAQKRAIESGVRLGQRVARPFMFQAVSENPADLQACSRIWARDMVLETPAAPHDRAARKNHKKIRLGYSSGEFREQATQILMAGLYDAHDRDRFELVAIDNGTNDGSAMRGRLENSFDEWIDISALSDEAAVGCIRAAEVDILVNLNGYFGKPRMGVFARRPAPVQVNYLGFPATLGTACMDYIIADHVVIPDGEQRFYDERVVTLPGCYQANDNKGRAIAAAPSRAEAGLPGTGFVFCNFNNAYKLTPDSFAGWMRILKQVDGSLLWLLESPAPFADNIRAAAQKHGVDGGRILFAPDRAPAEHLARLGLADLFLDSLPYNAHTTASDALWAGLPLLTRRGSAFAGRVATSALLAAGLPELVTDSQDDYEAQAVRLAGDAGLLKTLRGRLEKTRDRCELFDTDLFRRRIEAAYEQMWQRWLAGEAPQAFAMKVD